jgi:hypothetical protein
MLVVLKPNQHGQEVLVVSFNSALQRIKSDLAGSVSDRLVDSICDDLHIRYRKRLLTPMVTTYLALTRAMHSASMSALRHVSGFDVSAQAYCDGIGRLPVEYFARLQRAVAQECRPPNRPTGRWNGRRLFLIDGTAFSMPDTPELQEAFGQHPAQKPGCGFPIAHLLIQFDADTGVALRTIASTWRTHDLAHAARTHDALKPGDVLVGDRAFGSFAHMALLRQRGLHGVFRVHQRRLTDTDRRPKDRLVFYPKPTKPPAWMTYADYARLPDRIAVREVPVRVRTPGRRVQRLTIATTLIDAVAFPAKMIADMFAARWQAETNFGYLKQTLKLDVLRSQSPNGILKELHCITIIYNLVRRVMLHAAHRQHVEPNRVSFIDALRWLRRAQPDDELPELIINPDRPGRFEPRVRKRRPKSYPLMTKPRHELKKMLLSQATERLT